MSQEHPPGGTAGEPWPPSLKPYLIRAWVEWCGDEGLTPLVLVAVDGSVDVPRALVQQGRITLNIGGEAVAALQIDNESLSCKARFNGVAREIYAPLARVAAIFARETGQGLSFPVTEASAPNAPPAPQAPEPPRIRRVK